MENKSDQKNAQNDESAAVDAFFAKNRKAKGDKKKKNKAKASETQAEQEPKEVAKPEPAKQAQPNYDSDDSDEGKQTIVLETTKIQDMGKEKEEEKKAEPANFGWGKMESKAKTAASTQEAKKPDAARKPGEINFRGGRPQMFTSNKKKGLGLAQEEFPELGAIGTPGKGDAKGSDAQASKANQSTIGQFGAMAQERDGDRPQENKQAKKPMFTGKAKLNLGSSTDVNARQNYDFSSMNMAQATSGKPKLDEDGKPIPRDNNDQRRTRERAREQAVADDEDGFEVVTEKKPRRKNFGDDGW